MRMGSAEREYRKDEKINGVIYDMSPASGYRHGIINSNIHRILGNGLRGSLCLVFMENLDFQYQPEENDDYLCPDIMVICDRKNLKGSYYKGVPKFIVETLSPSTAKWDRAEKKDIYEKSGVEEYWIVSPQGSVEIYYLENRRYVLEQSYLLEDDKEDANYNADTEIALRAFPHIKLTLAEIFEGVNG